MSQKKFRQSWVRRYKKACKGDGYIVVRSHDGVHGTYILKSDGRTLGCACVGQRFTDKCHVVMPHASG